MRTEERNPKTMNLDRVDTLTAVELINAEDQTVAEAVRRVLPAIADAVDRIAGGLARGGRLTYVGALPSLVRRIFDWITIVRHSAPFASNSMNVWRAW